MHSMLGNSPKHLWVMLSPRRGVFANRGKGVSSDALVWGRPPQQGGAFTARGKANSHAENAENAER